MRTRLSTPHLPLSRILAGEMRTGPLGGRELGKRTKGGPLDGTGHAPRKGRQGLRRNGEPSSARRQRTLLRFPKTLNPNSVWYPQETCGRMAHMIPEAVRDLVPRASLAQFCKRRKITELALFGSALGTDFRPDSDLDLLVTFAPDAGWSGWDLVSIQDELAALFGRKVDLVERAAVERSENWIRRRHILTHAEPLYVEG